HTMGSSLRRLQRQATPEGNGRRGDPRVPLTPCDRPERVGVDAEPGDVRPDLPLPDSVGHRARPAREIVQARRPRRLPVVLTREEVARVLAELSGVHLLVAGILYGAGLRLLEALRLRVKDVDF